MKSDSAQITIDYIVGIGIFLLAVFFIFQFTYGLFIPFQSSSDKVTLAADRVATMLVERLLHADSSSALNVIDRGKLYYLNNTKMNQNYTDTLLELGLSSDKTVFDLNISVANLTSPNNPMNQSGPSLPDNTDIGQTRRMVLIVNSSTGYNETAIFSVRVW